LAGPEKKGIWEFTALNIIGLKKKYRKGRSRAGKGEDAQKGETINFEWVMFHLRKKGESNSPNTSAAWRGRKGGKEETMHVRQKKAHRGKTEERKGFDPNNAEGWKTSATV